MNNEEVFNIFKQRTTTRQYLDKIVPEKDIDTIIECGYLAPCAMHIKASHLYKFKKGEDKFNYLVDTLTKKMGRNPFYNANNIIVETIEKRSVEKEKDASCVIENMLLAGCLLGYGTCWINACKDLSDEDKKMLGIPQEYIVIAGIIVGYKA